MEQRPPTPELERAAKLTPRGQLIAVLVYAVLTLSAVAAVTYLVR